MEQGRIWWPNQKESGRMQVLWNSFCGKNEESPYRVQIDNREGLRVTDDELLITDTKTFSLPKSNKSREIIRAINFPIQIVAKLKHQNVKLWIRWQEKIAERSLTDWTKWELYHLICNLQSGISASTIHVKMKSNNEIKGAECASVCTPGNFCKQWSSLGRSIKSIKEEDPQVNSRNSTPLESTCWYTKMKAFATQKRTMSSI